MWNETEIIIREKNKTDNWNKETDLKNKVGRKFALLFIAMKTRNLCHN